MKKILAIVLAIITVVGCVFAFTACNDTEETTLTLATNAEFAPYEYKIGNKYYGIDMEIAKILAEELGMKLVISDMDFNAVVTSVQQGDADIGLSCLTITPVRQQSVTFSIPYEEGASQVLIVKNDNTAFDACTTTDQVLAVFAAMQSEVNIGVQKGTTGKDFVAGDDEIGFTGIPNAEASEFNNGALAVQDLKNGGVQYVVIDKAVANSLVAQNPNDIKVIDVDLTTEQYAIGVNKDKPELLEKINAVLTKIKNDGTLDAIYAAYANVGEDGDTAPTSDKYVGIEG